LDQASKRLKEEQLLSPPTPGLDQAAKMSSDGDDVYYDESDDDGFGQDAPLDGGEWILRLLFDGKLHLTSLGNKTMIRCLTLNRTTTTF